MARVEVDIQGIKCKLCNAIFKKITSPSIVTEDCWKLIKGDSKYVGMGLLVKEWKGIRDGKSPDVRVCPGCNCNTNSLYYEGRKIECNYCGRKLIVRGQQLQEVELHEITNYPKNKVIIHSKSVVWPPFCSICLGPVEMYKTRTDRSSLNLGIYYQSKTLTLPDVPYCADCHQKVKKMFIGKEQEGIRMSTSSNPNQEIMEIYFRNPTYAKMFRELNER
ncbi:MAG: hypothetical protein P1P80_06270 [ANME-2 cluster archaeon]|nr:hypothetical protein [ANME-2 cluster archaeon]